MMPICRYDRCTSRCRKKTQSEITTLRMAGRKPYSWCNDIGAHGVSVANGGERNHRPNYQGNLPTNPAPVFECQLLICRRLLTVIRRTWMGDLSVSRGETASQRGLSSEPHPRHSEKKTRGKSVAATEEFFSRKKIRTREG